MSFWKRRYYKALPASYDESMSYLEQVRLLCQSVRELAEVVEQSQEKLVSGMNIKTINGLSLLGAGNLNVSGEDAGVQSIGGSAGVITLGTGLKMTGKQLGIDNDELVTDDKLTTALATKQNTLTSGTNIKTVNETSILGNGNLAVGLPVLTGVKPTTATVGKAGQLYQDTDNHLWYCTGKAGASYLWKEVLLASMSVTGSTLNITL